MTSSTPNETLLIAGARVYDHEGDTDRPPILDILVQNGRIARIAPGLAAELQGAAAPDRVLDAHDHLVCPGFVNAHYHSHDVLLKGSFEAMPLHMWFVNALPPQYPRRSPEEIRARTLLGAAECIHAGITTVQDMLTIHPFDPADLDVVLASYREIGLRTVMSLQVGDLKGLDRIPFWREVVPEAYHGRLAGAVAEGAPRKPLDLVAEQYRRCRDADPGRLHWALTPTSAIMSSRALLEGIAALSHEHDLPVLTHLYESRPEAHASRTFFTEHGGSQLRYLQSVGLLNDRLALAHSVWLRPDEITLLAETGTSVVLNPSSNLKSRSGIAPARAYFDAGVAIALGCDNCACSDVQNMFQSMKLFCGFAGIGDPAPGNPRAADALRFATEGSARAVGLAGEVGAVKAGMKADLTLLDLTNLSFVPLNSAARQIVYTETGAAVSAVVIDGRVVMEGRRLTTIDEAELRDAVDVLMDTVRGDRDAVSARFAELYPFLAEAWQRAWTEDLEVQRYLP